MQYDFVDQPFTEFNNGKERIIYAEGGAFSAPESSYIVPEIAGLVPKFKNSLIIATKDYHPKDHCSFKEGNPPYPPHCVVGTKGAKIVKPIWKAIRSLANAYIAFKGFHPEYDSYSALEYKTTTTPTLRCKDGDDTSWTGSFVVKTTDNQYRKLYDGRAAAVRFGADDNYYDRSDTYSKQYNPPEDEFKELVDACTDNNDRKYFNKTSCDLQHVEELLKRKDKNTTNIFICGLVGDICVLDTAINLIKNGYKNVYIIFDLTRMVYIPGPGYIMPPKKYAEILNKNDIKLIESKNITRSVP
jgi:nicotinamidase-related amidase